MPTLPQFQNDNQPFQMMQNSWASKLNPLFDQISTLQGQYEEGSFVANFNMAAGAGGTNTVYTIHYARIGSIVTLSIPAQNIVAGATSASLSTADNTIPGGLVPKNNTSIACRVQSNGIQTSPGLLTIGKQGGLTVIRIFDASVTFGSGQTIGIFQNTLPVTYSIQ